MTEGDVQDRVPQEREPGRFRGWLDRHPGVEVAAAALVVGAVLAGLAWTIATDAPQLPL